MHIQILCYGARAAVAGGKYVFEHYRTLLRHEKCLRRFATGVAVSVLLAVIPPAVCDYFAAHPAPAQQTVEASPKA